MQVRDPEALVSDNGKQFDNPKFRDFYTKLGIKNYYSSSAHSQSNGQSEVTIRTLKAALKTKLEDLKGKWENTSPRCYGHTELRASPQFKRPHFLWNLAITLVEVGLKSPRIEFASAEHNKEVLCLNLDLLEEKQEQVLKRIENYHKKTARYYDRRVKPRNYNPGDLVLKKLLPTRKDPIHRKLGPNWEGPYIVSRIVRPSNYELQTE